MTLNTSNTLFVEVLEALPLENIGWYCKVLAETDYSTVIAQVFRYRELTFLKEHNGPGGGSIVIDVDDPIWTQALPAGQTTALIDQQAVWQVYEDGILRGEFFAEDVEQDVVTEDGDRVNVITGRGVGACLEWAVLPNTPGTTPGEVSQNGAPLATIRSAVIAAQLRGVITFVNVTFDAFADSRGAAWLDAYWMTYSHGDNLLDTVSTWCDQIGATWKMLSGFRLWVEKDSGNDKTSTVIFPIGIAQQSHNKKRSRRELGNYIYATGSDGSQGTAADSASITKWKKREKWIDAGQAGNSAAASAAALINLGLFSGQQVSREVEIIPNQTGRRLFVDFDVWDWVRVEAETGDTDAVDMRVVSASIVVGSDGNAVSELSLGSRYDEAQVEAAKQMKKLESAKVPAKAVAKKKGAPSSLANRSIGDLKDVDTTVVNNYQTLVYNSTTQVFEAGDPRPLETLVLALGDEATVLTTGLAKVTLRAPFAMTLAQIPRASLTVASSSGNPTVDVNVGGTSVLGAAKLTVDSGETTSTTAATPTTLGTTAVADDAQITIDVDVAGTGAKGLKVTLFYRRA
jgi:hypothetical protein